MLQIIHIQTTYTTIMHITEKLNHIYHTIQNIIQKILYTSNTINYKYIELIIYTIIYTILQIHIININHLQNRTTSKTALLKPYSINYIIIYPLYLPAALGVAISFKLKMFKNILRAFQQ